MLHLSFENENYGGNVEKEEKIYFKMFNIEKTPSQQTHPRARTHTHTITSNPINFRAHSQQKRLYKI